MLRQIKYSEVMDELLIELETKDLIDIYGGGYKWVEKDGVMVIIWEKD